MREKSSSVVSSAILCRRSFDLLTVISYFRSSKWSAKGKVNRKAEKDETHQCR